MSKYLPSHLKVECKLPSNIVELIQTNVGFEDLEEFESSFEQDEIVDI